MATNLRFDEITDVRDSRLMAWLDIYEASFPQVERVPVSAHLRDLYAEATDADTRTCHRLVALDAETDAVVGMARYDFSTDANSIYLMYFAVAPNLRGAGVGAAMFAEIGTRSRAAYPNADLLAWEVERTDKIRSRHGKEDAERRIRFYRRQGARLVRGTNYSARARADFPRVLFDLMFLPLREGVTDAEVFQILRELFGFSTPDAELSLT